MVYFLQFFNFQKHLDSKYSSNISFSLACAFSRISSWFVKLKLSTLGLQINLLIPNKVAINCFIPSPERSFNSFRGARNSVRVLSAFN